MLSRPRSIDCIASIGTPDREVLERGPPAALAASLAKLFAQRKETTRAAILEARNSLGW